MLITSKSSILVNGSMNGYIRYRRRIREGNPLSPLLFVLVADVLSTMFSNARLFGVLYGVPLGGLVKICHLQYADDLIILTARSAEDLRIIKLILHLLKVYLGWPLISTKHASIQ